MARLFRQMDALREIGRDGGFIKLPSIDAKYVRHHDSINIGTEIDDPTSGRKRNSHGGVRNFIESSERKTN